MDVPTVESNSKCWCFTGTQAQGAMLYLLNQIAGGTMTAAEVQENSRCWCFTGIAFQRAMIYLLNQIMVGGGGGGGLSFSTGTGSPEGSVVGSPGDTYWDTATGFYYIKVTGTATNTGWQIH